MTLVGSLKKTNKLSIFSANKIYFLVSDKNINKIRESFLTLSYRCISKKLENEFIEINSKKDFSNTVSIIERECKENNILPYIHIECHGKIQGLVLNSGGLINWNELSNYLTRINIVCKNNLFISLASCYGGFLSISLLEKMTAGKKPRAPFYGILGPKDVISYQEIDVGFENYFEVIIGNTDFNLGVNEINKSLEKSRGYSYQTCESVYFQIANEILNYVNETKYKNELTFNSHVLDIGSKYFYKTGIIPIKSDYEYLSKILAKKDFYIEYMNLLRSYFFMIDLYPENDKRFAKLS